MQWSKLRRHIEERFAASLQGRVEIRDTWYRHGGRDRDGRVWLTVDGQEVASFCDFRYWNAARPLIFQARHSDIDFPYDAAEEKLNAEGVFSRSNAHGALRESLSLSIDDMLRSSVAIIRALAMLDSRLGKRRLSRLSFTDDETSLVRACYSVRCEADGIVPVAESDHQIGPRARYSEEAIGDRVERKRRFYKRIPMISPNKREELVRRYAEETSNPLKSLDGTDDLTAVRIITKPLRGSSRRR